MKVEPYLNFNGRCDEALQFYKQAIGAETEMLMRFRDSPDPANIPPGSGDRVMHCSFLLFGQRIMATDGMCIEGEKFQGFSLAISVPDVAAAEKVFQALQDGGTVTMPLTETFFSPRFGMLLDRFGLSWMVVTEAK